MTWFIVGCGEYRLQGMDGNSTGYVPLDRAVDVYLDEWVKIRLLLYLGITQRQDISASNPAFSYDPAHVPVTGTGGKLR